MRNDSGLVLWYNTVFSKLLLQSSGGWIVYCRLGSLMASPEGETANSGAEACLLEVQLKALVGLMQATIDKALKDRGRGSDSPVGCG
jgi:hypothetical protein